MRLSDRANRAAADWTARVVNRITPADAIRISTQLLATVDDVSANRWDAAKSRAAALSGDLRPDKVDALTQQFSRELGAAGAAVGATAATPAIGTVTTLAATLAELAWFTGRAGDLVLTIAALHGKEDPTVEERRAWVLAVMIYGSSARDGFARAVNEATSGLGVTADGRLPSSTLQLANRLMASTFARRYGTRRGIAALGRFIPIGIGAAVGGATNYLAIRHLAKSADQFFARLPYSAIDVESRDVTGREVGRRSSLSRRVRSS